MSLSYFIQREKALLGARYDAFYASPDETAVRGITVSALRCSPETFAQKAGITLEPSPFCTAGFVVRQADFKPGRHPYHAAGVFYSQEPSASSAAPLLGVKPGMRVLDACAAPGGKTSQLASALAGKGLLVANEYVAERAEILKQNLERMGVSNVVILNEDTARIAAAMPEFFDRILVDAPCSGEGMFRKEPQAATQHSEELVKQCAALGSTILDNAAAALAPGGVIVYSTCTFAPEEDEAQIGAFLARHPDFSLRPVLEESTISFGSEGEENRCGENPFDTGLVRRIWPFQGGEGHFMARLQKAGTPRTIEDGNVPAPEQAAWLAAAQGGAPYKKGAAPAQRDKHRPERFARKSGEAAASASSVLTAWKTFAAENFPALCDAPAAVRGETVLLIPAFPPIPLHILRAGVLAGSMQNGRFVPAHHLFTAYGALCKNSEQLTLGDARTAAYLHGEEVDAKTAQNGWCCVLVDGFPLGGGKASNGRVKNHYPKALRFL